MWRSGIFPDCPANTFYLYTSQPSILITRLFNLLLVSFCCLNGVFLHAQTGKPSPAQWIVDMGKKQYQQSDYAAAERTFTKAILADSLNAEAWEMRGDCRLVLRSYTGAIEDYTRVIQFKPKYAYVYGARAAARYRQGSDSSAVIIADLQQAIKLNPKFYDAYQMLSRACFDDGRLILSLRYVTKAIELERLHPDNYLLRARIMETIGDEQLMGEDLNSYVFYQGDTTDATYLRNKASRRGQGMASALPSSVTLNETQLAGKWKIDSANMSIGGRSGFLYNGADTVSAWKLDRIQFNKDGTGSRITGKDTTGFEYCLFDGKFYLHFNDSPMYYHGKLQKFTSSPRVMQVYFFERRPAYSFHRFVYFSKVGT